MPTVALLLLTLFAAAPGDSPTASPARGTVIAARKQVIVAQTWKLAPDLGVEAQTLQGESARFGPKDVLLVDADESAWAGGDTPQVLLRNGEVLNAELAPGAVDKSFTFASPAWGRVEVPLDQITLYRTGPLVMGKDQPDPPFVLLRNGDAVAGTIRKVEKDQVTVNTEFGETQLPSAAVLGIVISRETPASVSRPGGALLIETADGQRLFCQRLSEADGRITLLRGEVKCMLDRSMIRRIIWPSATSAELAAMPFTCQGTGYFGQPLNPRKDRSASGRPLRIGDRWFTSGLGTRPRSHVRFNLDANWSYLIGRVGLDPSLGRSGDCEVSVVVDGGEAFKGRLQGGRPGYRLLVPLGDAKAIELRVDFGANGDLGDYVNWCDLLLIGLRGEAGK